LYRMISAGQAREDITQFLPGCASPGDSDKFYLGMLAK